MSKRTANARKKEKAKIKKEQRYLHREITKLISLNELPTISKNQKAAIRLKLTRLIEIYKSKNAKTD